MLDIMNSGFDDDNDDDIYNYTSNTDASRMNSISQANQVADNATLRHYHDYTQDNTRVPSYLSGLIQYNNNRSLLAQTRAINPTVEELAFKNDSNDCIFPETILPQSYDVSGSKEPQGKKAKKDPNSQKPKRPLSAYNFFFHHERQQILEHMPTRAEGKPRRSHGKIGFADLARSIAAKWKSISEEERKVFDDKAIADKERYVKEMEEWKKTQLLEVSQAAAIIAPSFHQLNSVKSGMFSSYGQSGLEGFPGMMTSSNSEPDMGFPPSESKKFGNMTGVLNYSSSEPAFTITEAFALNRAQRTQERITAALNIVNNAGISDSLNAASAITQGINLLGDANNQRFPPLIGNSFQQQFQQYDSRGAERIGPEQQAQQTLPSASQISELATQLDDESTQLLLNIFR